MRVEFFFLFMFFFFFSLNRFRAVQEEELRNCDDPKYEHLKENLYVFIEARGSQGIAAARLAAGVAEVRKMLIPCVSSIDQAASGRQFIIVVLFYSSAYHIGANRSPGPVFFHGLYCGDYI